MPYKRIAAAAALVLSALYIKFCMPSFYETMQPAVREALAQEQAGLSLPPEIASWLTWE